MLSFEDEAVPQAAGRNMAAMSAMSAMSGGAGRNAPGSAATGDDPVIAGRGSAIFLHIARPGYLPTEGCIALSLGHMLEVMALAEPGSAIKIAAD